MFPRRINRVESLLAREISAILQRHQERIGQITGGALLTVTGVKVGRNLEYASVYYSCVGGKSKDAKSWIPVLEQEIQPLLSRTLAGRVALKKMPKIRFEHDAGFERADRVYGILENLRRQDDA
ncbi:MAG: 30S ribosome-binding factor RbfA [Elusimicrobiota bacterium]